MEQDKKNKIIVGIIVAMSFLLVALGLINEDVSQIIHTGLKIIFIPIEIIIVFGILYLATRYLFKKGKWYFKALGISIIISSALLLSGISLLAYNTSISSKTNEGYFRVLNVKDNQIYVLYTNYKEEEKVVKIHKPIFSNVKEGDTISVIYNIKNPEKMHMIVGREAGIISLAIGIILIDVIIKASFIVLFIYLIDTHKKSNV